MGTDTALFFQRNFKNHVFMVEAKKWLDITIDVLSTANKLASLIFLLYQSNEMDFNMK